MPATPPRRASPAGRAAPVARAGRPRRPPPSTPSRTAAPTVILAPVLAYALAQLVAGLGPLDGLGLGDDVAITQAAFVVPAIAALIGTLGLTIPALAAQGDPSQARARASR